MGCNVQNLKWHSNRLQSGSQRDVSLELVKIFRTAILLKKKNLARLENFPSPPSSQFSLLKVSPVVDISSIRSIDQPHKGLDSLLRNEISIYRMAIDRMVPYSKFSWSSIRPTISCNIDQLLYMRYVPSFGTRW